MALCVRRGSRISKSLSFSYLSRPVFSTTTTHPADQGLLRIDDVESGIVTLTLNRPSKRNALSLGLLKELQEELLDIEQDQCQKYRCVVINSKGNVFCSGHDLKEIATNNVDHLELFRTCSDVMKLITTIPQPVIASVQGIATAAGCQLVGAADLSIATSTAKFATPGVDIGLFCSTPAVSIARCVPKKHAMRMLLTGEMLSATHALSIGLLSHVVAENQDLHQETYTIARNIASKSGKALQIGKQVFNKQIECSLEEAYDITSSAMADNLKTCDAQEGITAFLQKRIPVWQNR